MNGTISEPNPRVKEAEDISASDIRLTNKTEMCKSPVEMPDFFVEKVKERNYLTKSFPHERNNITMKLFHNVENSVKHKKQ